MKRLFPILFILCVVGIYGAPLLQGQVTQPSTSQAVTTVPGTIQSPTEGGQKAVAVTTVPSPAAPQNPLDQIVWAAAASYIIQLLKKWNWFPLISEQSTSKMKALFSFFVAAGTAAGIHLIVNGSPFDPSGASITMTGLSFDAFKDIGFQWLSQQVWYDALVRKSVSGRTE